MTYLQWAKAHRKKVIDIKSNLSERGYSKKQILDYFDYNNMIIRHKDFCLLYKDNKKCHDIENLNCYLCACPYFVFNDYTPIRNNEYSICKVDSKFSKIFEFEDKKHCDCSDCIIPHTRQMCDKFYSIDSYDFMEGVSILENLRAFQLSDILGKFKLF